MATGQLNLQTVKLGDNADTSKNFLIKVPAVADGSLSIQTESGVPVLIRTAAGVITLGAGQTWQDVTGSRVSGTYYTNSTGLPIHVNAYSTGTSGGVSSVSMQVGGQVVSYQYCPAIAGSTFVSNASVVVPPGVTYRITWVGTAVIMELR